MPVGKINGSARQKPVIGKDQHFLRERGGKGIVAGSDDDRAEEALCDLIPGRMIRVRMIPVCPGAARLKRKYVVVLFSGCDRIKWAPIGCHGDMQSVPVDSRRHGELVVEMHDHLVALANLESRPWHPAVISEGVALRPRNE